MVCATAVNTSSRSIEPMNALKPEKTRASARVGVNLEGTGVTVTGGSMAADINITYLMGSSAQ